MKSIHLYARSYKLHQNNQYIAKITGRHERYTFERELCGNAVLNRTEAIIDKPGLYEIANINREGVRSSVYRLIVPQADGDGLILLHVGGDYLGPHDTDAESIACLLARRMDGGQRLSDMIQLEDTEDGWGYRIAPPLPVEKETKMRTRQQAADECVRILQAFSLKDVRLILKEIREQLFPGPIELPDKPGMPPAPPAPGTLPEPTEPLTIPTMERP